MESFPTRVESPGRQARRVPWLRLAALVAVAEAVLVLVGVIPVGIAIGIAVAIVAAYVVLRSRLRWAPVRTALWSVSVSQAIILFVPLLLALAGWILLSAIAVAGALLLLFLLVDRR